MSAKASERESYAPEEVVVAYHERTKHHFHRFAASLGYMDWATQPDPFRRYAGADLVRLPLPKAGRPLPYWQLYAIGTVPPEPLSAGVGLPLLPVRTVSDGVEAIPRDDVVACARTPRAGISIRPRGMPFCPRSSGSATRPPCTTTLRGSTLSNGERFSTRSGGPSSSRPSLTDRSSWVCRRSIGGKPGSTVSARSGTASTMSDTRLPPCASRRQLSAGDWCSSTASGTASSLASLGLGRDEDFGEAEREEPELLALIAPELSSTRSTRLERGDGGGRWCALAGQGQHAEPRTQHRVACDR